MSHFIQAVATGAISVMVINHLDANSEPYLRVVCIISILLCMYHWAKMFLGNHK